MLTFIIAASTALLMLMVAGLAIAGTIVAMVCWAVLLLVRMLFRITVAPLGGFFGIVLLPLLLIVVGIIVVGTIIAVAIGVIVPGLLPLAAVALIGWAIYKGATRNRPVHRTSGSGPDGGHPSSVCSFRS